MNDSSGVNTIILVLILALVIFGMVWFFKDREQVDANPQGFNVELNLPTSDKEAGVN